jgi:hypothetical protein
MVTGRSSLSFIALIPWAVIPWRGDQRIDPYRGEIRIAGYFCTITPDRDRQKPVTFHFGESPDPGS